MKIIWNFAHLQRVINNIVWASFICSSFSVDKKKLDIAHKISFFEHNMECFIGLGKGVQKLFVQQSSQNAI